MSGREIRIALAGNPNSGKSTLFNLFTGLNQKISNYPGTTVDILSGSKTLQDGTKLHVTDLPGFYSLYPKGEDERVAVKEILRNSLQKQYDLVVYIADTSNLRRSLLLFSQIVDLKEPVILALNMTDLARKKGLVIETDKLSEVLGVPVFEIEARRDKGIKPLIEGIKKEVSPPSFSFYPSSFFENKTSELIKPITGVEKSYPNFLFAQNPSLFPEHADELTKILKDDGFNAVEFQSKDSLNRFKVIDELLSFCSRTTIKQAGDEFTSKVDKILTHKIWGYLIFIAVFFLMFQAIFSLAQYPMDWISGLFANFSSWIQDTLPDNAMTSLLANGVIAGLGGVVVFVPQIAILFGFLTILEDTGYMSRVSFIMDRLMRGFGLNGKSVVPLIGGLACAIPSIMAARTIENPRERLLTIMVTPLMSCSARLPVYTLLISLIIPNETILGIFNIQGLVLFGMYMLGVVASLGVAAMINYFLRNKGTNYFIMEMPVYRMPLWKNVLSNMVSKSKTFVFNAGKIIVIVSIVLWFLGSYGPGNTFSNIEAKYHNPSYTQGLNSDGIEAKINAEKLANSYAGHFGKFIEPAIKPLGFNWEIGIALLSSLAAREVFVGTMSTIYSLQDGDNTVTLKEKMQAERDPVSGKPVYTTAVAFSLMIFYAFALQCASTIATVRRETGTWKWPIIQFILLTALAYFASLLVYQVMK